MLKIYLVFLPGVGLLLHIPQVYRYTGIHTGSQIYEVYKLKDTQDIQVYGYTIYTVIFEIPRYTRLYGMKLSSLVYSFTGIQYIHLFW